MKLGSFEVTALNDGLFKLPVDKLLQTTDPNLVAARLRAEYPHERFPNTEVVTILNESDTLQGEQRTAFVKERMEALQQEVLARRQA